MFINFIHIFKDETFNVVLFVFNLSFFECFIFLIRFIYTIILIACIIPIIADIIIIVIITIAIIILIWMVKSGFEFGNNIILRILLLLIKLLTFVLFSIISKYGTISYHIHIVDTVISQ